MILMLSNVLAKDSSLISEKCRKSQWLRVLLSICKHFLRKSCARAAVCFFVKVDLYHLILSIILTFFVGCNFCVHCRSVYVDPMAVCFINVQLNAARAVYGAH